MIGNVFVPLLLLTCLAEGMAQGRPRRAAHLKNLRQLIVVAWIVWIVQHSWSSSALPPWLVFESVVAARLFLVAFLGVILWLVASGVLASKWPELRSFLAAAHMVNTVIFALVLGATVDWSASSPAVFVFALVNLGVLVAITWKAASADWGRRQGDARYLTT